MGNGLSFTSTKEQREAKRVAIDYEVKWTSWLKNTAIGTIQFEAQFFEKDKNNFERNPANIKSVEDFSGNCAGDVNVAESGLACLGDLAAFYEDFGYFLSSSWFNVGQ